MSKLSRTVQATTATTAIELLAAAVPELSKGRLKDAMNKGAVLLLAKPQKRLRRAQAALAAGDKLTLNYDEALLQRRCEPAQLLADLRHYSIWFKPAGMLSQGNEWGDHLSLLRAVELHFGGNKPVFLVHRLDREASGLVIIAHSKQAAAAFSKLIAERQLDKHYVIRVKGQLEPSLLTKGGIEQPLDGKASTTQFVLRHYDTATDSSWLTVKLISGRKHQIRRHFADAGYAVLGDPQYGKHNKDKNGLALQAVKLAFNCPFSRKPQCFMLPTELLIYADLFDNIDRQ